MQGKTLSFVSLFNEVDVIEIPVIQRDYAQGRREELEIREQFLLSIRNALTSQDGAIPLDLDFIYGNLSGNEVTHLSVLDGQQRLTTLFLLHWYLAQKEEAHADFSERFTLHGKSRFTYLTRTAATEFFHALVRSNNSRLLFGEGAPSIHNQITDSRWFYHSWLADPTVAASLTMLESIQECYGSMSNDLYESLCSDSNPPVVFQYLNLESFGLSDELYIKMNSRGKALTDFENFKAWLSGWMKNQPDSITFGERIDQTWTDLFWSLSKKSSVNFDTLFLRFFKRMAFLLECSQSLDPAYMLASKNVDWFNSLRSTRDGFNSPELIERKTFSEKNINIISTVLDFLCSDKASCEHESLLREFLTGNDLLGICRFYALCVFITSEDTLIEKYQAEQYAQWKRVTDNFLQTTRIDSNQVATGVIRILDNLSTHTHEIYYWLCCSEQPQGFAEQWEEEVLKARLIMEKSEWEEALILAESHPYLKGRVRGLLEGAYNHKTGDHDLERFITLTEKIFWILNDKVLHNPKRLLERALLSLGDYLVWQKGKRYTFCLPAHNTWRDRYENWIKVVEKKLFINLLDLMPILGNATDALSAVIATSTPNGWRKLIVQDPEVINYCSERIIDKSGEQIYLLSKTNLRGYFKELYSWSLYKEMLKLLQDTKEDLPYITVKYHSVYGDEWPCIELILRGEEDKSRFIAHESGVWFDCESIDNEDNAFALPEFFEQLAERLLKK